MADVVEAFNPDPPELSPYIQYLNEGDIVNLFCLSGESSPPAEITWQASITRRISIYKHANIYSLKN